MARTMGLSSGGEDVNVCVPQRPGTGMKFDKFANWTSDPNALRDISSPVMVERRLNANRPYWVHEWDTSITAAMLRGDHFDWYRSERAAMIKMALQQTHEEIGALNDLASLRIMDLAEDHLKAMVAMYGAERLHQQLKQQLNDYVLSEVAALAGGMPLEKVRAIMAVLKAHRTFVSNEETAADLAANWEAKRREMRNYAVAAMSGRDAFLDLFDVEERETMRRIEEGTASLAEVVTLFVR
ncbi:MAG: hypothetical protein MHM6MM_009625, partial [Cercozoa sp. M6MM]